MSNIVVVLTLAGLQAVSTESIFNNVQPMIPTPPVDPLGISGAVKTFFDGVDYVFGDRIVGGDEVAPHSYPHQAALHITKNGKGYFCGGSLISSSWVLTAAHCVHGSSVGVTVVLGVHNIYNNEQSTKHIRADTIVVHPRYPKNGNDIALLKLSESVKLDGKYIDIIRLPKESQKSESFYKKEVGMIGWGRVSDKGNDLSPVLRSVHTWVVSNVYCGFRYFYALPKSEMCASGHKAKGTCNGDSGGPLYIREERGEKTIVGITAWGHKRCQWSWPPVFTRVTSFLDWIHETTGIAPRY